MYHKEPFDLSVRGTFELPAWPHNDDQESKDEFEKYLRELTVFRYQNSQIKDYPDKIDQIINLEFDEQLPNPFQAYYSVCLIDDEELKVRNWVEMPRGKMIMDKVKEHPIAGDMKGWDFWNIPGKVSIWNQEVIKFDRDVEMIDSIKGPTRCDDKMVPVVGKK